MPDSYLAAYLSVAILALTGAGFVLFLVGLSYFIQRRNPYPAKLSTYECGILPVGEGWSPFAVRYYLFALLFLVFDVEAVYIFPWAVVFRSLGMVGFVEMMIFIGVLTIGLVYAWAKGALEWV